MFFARVKQDYKIVQLWFINRNPFTSGEQLLALDSGMVHSENHVTFNPPEEIGADEIFSNVIF